MNIFEHMYRKMVWIYMNMVYVIQVSNIKMIMLLKISKGYIFFDYMRIIFVLFKIDA